MDVLQSSFVVIVFLSLTIRGLAENFKIYMVSAGTCGDVVFHVDPETSYTVLWQGDNPGPLGCRYHFNAKSGQSSNRQVCVEARDFFLETSGVYLSYFEVPNSTLSKVYTKGIKPQTFCTSNAKDLEVEVKTIFSSPSRLQSHFTLHVYGKYATNSHPDVVGMKIGFTVAGSIILLLVIAIIVKVKLYRRETPPKHSISSFSTSFTEPVATSSVPSPSSSEKHHDLSPDQPEIVLAVHNLDPAVHNLDPMDSDRSRAYQTDTVVFNKDTEQLIV